MGSLEVLVELITFKLPFCTKILLGCSREAPHVIPLLPISTAVSPAWTLTTSTTGPWSLLRVIIPATNSKFVSLKHHVP